MTIDTREQAPLDFKEGVFDEIVREACPVGDYWFRIDGKEVPIAFERKSLGDLFGTMTYGYPRFKHEMERAKEAGLQLVLLIEGSMGTVFKGFEHSQFKGESMLKKLAMLRVRYDLEYHFCNNRREMARLIEDWFLAVSRNWSSSHYKNDEANS